MARTPTTRRDDPVLARNRPATHEYSILETFEAGIALTGTEVKALRAGRTQLREGYVRIENGEAWLLQVHISEYEQGNRIKLEIGLALGKRLWDKRQAIAERDARRDAERLTRTAMR